MNDQEYAYLKEKIFKLTSLDVNSYKGQQMRRRLEGFVEKQSASGVMEYCRLLEKDKGKCRELVDFLAINVSEFFRDENLFSYLRTEVLPELTRNNAGLSIWSAACSCGQEAYSIAISLEERGYSRYRIMATDIDESALATAVNGGPYPASEVRNVSRLIMSKYFKQDAAGYRVNEGIKAKVKFRRHNLLSDRFEQGFHLIVCRNVIIYFADRARDEIYRKFCGSLAPNGVLFVGGSEVILRPADIGFRIMRPSFYKKVPASVESGLLLKV